MGTYKDIAYELFGINDVNMDKDKLEKLLKNNNIEFNYNYIDEQSKLSGLPTIKVNNLNKWMNKYFEVNNIDLTLDAKVITSKDIDYDDLKKTIYSMINEGYSIDVGAGVNTEVWMSDGKTWEKPTTNEAGHQMNFEGFDNMGNILVCSWGKTYMFPKEFYQELEFMAIKLEEKNRIITR